MLKRAFLLTNRAHSIGNSTTALLLDDIGTIFDGLVDCRFGNGFVVLKKLRLFHCRYHFLLLCFAPDHSKKGSMSRVIWKRRMLDVRCDSRRTQGRICTNSCGFYNAVPTCIPSGVIAVLVEFRWLFGLYELNVDLQYLASLSLWYSLYCISSSAIESKDLLLFSLSFSLRFNS